MRLVHFLSIALLFILIIGCNERPLFSKKIDIEGTWNYDNKLTFPIEVDNLELEYDLILSLTYGTDFGYQNIYVKILTQYPSGNETEDILSLNLTDGAGIFLGDCNSSKCEIDILLQEKFKFKENGDHVITIVQNGREENLESVYGAEIKLFNAIK